MQPWPQLLDSHCLINVCCSVSQGSVKCCQTSSQKMKVTGPVLTSVGCVFATVSKNWGDMVNILYQIRRPISPPDVEDKKIAEWLKFVIIDTAVHGVSVFPVDEQINLYCHTALVYHQYPLPDQRIRSAVIKGGRADLGKRHGGLKYSWSCKYHTKWTQIEL